MNSKTILDYLYNDTEEEGGLGKTLSPVRPKVEMNFGDLQRLLSDISEHGIEITATFKPELQECYNSASLTAMVEKELYKYRKRYSFSCVMVGEYSKTGVYHMHGSIHAPSKMINSIRRNFPRLFGRTELKMIKWVSNWVDYVFKIDDEAFNLGVKHKDIDYNEIIVIN